MPYAPKLQTRGSSIRNEDAKELIVECVSTFDVCSMDLFCSLSGGSCEKGADSSRSNRSPARAASIERRKKENVQSKMSDIGCRMSNLRFCISDLRSRISDVGCRISNLGCGMSDINSRMSIVGYLI